MDLGRKSRDQPRKEKLGANKQRTSTNFETTPSLQRTNHTASPRRIEYIESSHPSVLARGIGTTTCPRSLYGSQSRSKRSSDDRRPCTPVPSLIGYDTMSPPSISTISPTTPVFDVALSRPSMSRPSHNRIPTPLDFDKISQKNDESPPKPQTTRSELDPASTYQPRRTIPVSPFTHSTSHSTNPASTEETSFIEWDDDDDDDDSRLQRMKQSLTFARSHRANKPNPIQPVSPDKQLNVTPRARRSPRNPQSTSPTYNYTAQPRSPTYNITQHRPLPTSVPAPSRQPRYQASNIIPPQPIQPPPLRHPESNRPAPHRISTSTPHPHYIRQDIHLPLSQPPYTSQVRPIQSDQHRHHIPPTNTETHNTSTTSNDTIASKPNRFKKLMRGVAERVSMRDLRKEASATGARK